MTHIKFALLLILIPLQSYASGLAGDSNPASTVTKINKISEIKEYWSADRFFPWIKSNSDEKKSAIKLGLRIKFVRLNLENDTTAQSGFEITPTGQVQQTSIGTTAGFGKTFTPSYEFLFIYKPSPALDSPIYGIDFWYLQMKPKYETTNATFGQVFSSTYQIAQNTYANDVIKINSSIEIKMRLLRFFFARYILSTKNFFFATGFGSRIHIIEQGRHITYSSPTIDQCLCFEQQINGIDLNILTNLGVNFSNKAGFELTYLTGLLVSNSKLLLHSYDESIDGGDERDNAIILSKTSDINPVQLIRAQLTYSNYQFKVTHYALKAGFELVTIQADKISQSLAEGSSITKTLSLPSVFVNFSVYF